MKNYLIIGASSGIGQALAKILTDNQDQVYGTYHQHPIDHGAVNFHVQALDVMSETVELEDLPDSLDGLVYCPGSINLRPFARIKPKDFVKDYELQVVGAIKVIQAMLGRLKKSEQASIVLFSTVAVQTGFPFHAQVAASKGAIEGLVRSLGAELAPTIRVNGIAPSLTNTPLASRLLSTPEKIEANAQRHPLKKIGTPEDLAEMAAFLLSEKSAWMSGQILHVDGGMSSLKV